MPISLTRRLAIVADVLDDGPEAATLRDVKRAVRSALTNEGFEIGTLDVRVISMERTV